MNNKISLVLYYFEFALIYLVFWAIIEFDSVFGLTEINSVFSALDSVAFFLVPPLAAALTYVGKPRNGFFYSLGLLLVIFTFNQVTYVSSENLSLLMVPFVMGWTIGFMFFAKVARFVLGNRES